MSISPSIFAERREGASWISIGEPYYLQAWDCFHPPQAFDINPRDELITVLNGFLTSPWGIEHTGLEVIAEPRGLPDDLSPELRDWADRVVEEGSGEHATWLLAREILDFDWRTPKILHRGYVMAEMARHFDPDRPEMPFPADDWPGGWYEWASMPGAVERLLESRQVTEDQLVHSWPRPGTEEVYWCESHFDVLGCRDEFLNELRDLGPPDAVRLVIWMDV